MMNKTRKVYVVGMGTGYANPIKNKQLVNTIQEADIVLFTGGADVDPSIYGKKAIEATWPSLRRDIYEKEFYEAMRPDQLAIGICRGLQLFCALNGGNLVQDTTNHAGPDHTVKILETGDIFMVSSLHHQMVYPFDMPNSDYTILGISEHNRSSYYAGDGIDPDVIKNFGEPEIVLFHKEGKPVSFGIQGHPEMMSPNSLFVQYENEMIEKLLKQIKG